MGKRHLAVSGRHGLGSGGTAAAVSHLYRRAACGAGGGDRGLGGLNTRQQNDNFITGNQCYTEVPL